MANQLTHLKPHNQQASTVELELLNSLLVPEDATYPWNPADAESEAYFIEQEKQFDLQELLDEELEVKSLAFFSQLDRLFQNQDKQSHVQAQLHASFAACIPQNWLDKIAQTASALFNSGASVADQLVECVQAVLPNWGEEDLLVLTRPYAYAMRGHETEKVEAVLTKVGDRDWTALSEVEQARVSIAIAQYALTQLNISEP